MRDRANIIAYHAEGIMAEHEAQNVNDVSLTEPHSAPPGRATPENREADAKTLGEGSGGFLGAVTGMALGVAGGPVGLVLGGIAGAVGGWWAGHGIAKAISNDDDTFYRSHYESSPERLADRGYDDVRAGYFAGHLAGRNPDYAGRSFEEIEQDLRYGWSDSADAASTDWPTMRGYARTGFERARNAGRTS
jgi:hypothetical protein